MGQPLKAWIGIFASLFLFTACGGDDLFTGDGSGLGGGDDALDSLTLLAAAPTLSSDASGVSSGIELTAFAKDASNNIAVGEEVFFSTSDPGAVLVVQSPVLTDETGQASAVLTTLDETNRTIVVTARSGELSSSVSVEVVGTQIDISGPAGTQLGVATEYVVALSDAAGDGIAGRTVEITTEAGNSLSAASLETNEFGQVTVDFTGFEVNSTLTASALGLSSTFAIAVSPDDFTVGVRRLGETDFISAGSSEFPELEVGQDYELVARWIRADGPVNEGTVGFSATRGTIQNPAEDAVSGGEASVVFNSTEAGPSIVSAFSDDLSSPNARTTVEFVATEPSSIAVQAAPTNVQRNQSSEIVAIVRDADNNLVKNVTVDFKLTDQTTGTLSASSAVTNSQGLARVTYTASSQSSGTEAVVVTSQVRSTPNVTDTVSLTVGGDAAGIALGTGSEILDKDESTYQLPFTIVVTDSGGNPAPDADVSITLFATRYFKGTFGSRTACTSEDVNRNDILDVGEDFNTSGRLEPGRRASIPATVSLDEFGSGQILVTYAKTDGFFVEVEITATALVSGTETSEKRRFTLTVAEDDVDNLPGISPFGTDPDCSSPN
ncbi:Ig domain protein group 1 domain protein [Oceanococcus atlanticus]|uniref:Ig domain protein group 1 domain protein n=1 Tax=Oceanococcus atlanticus TaxID=1317117 RepID=A0A1Y1SGP2_9GAMM|nr:Ig-like domain-containing protein [Oceanococcus atlanticus]ORE88842.1 Ig domain protein group 1 domain protein [Oceanococcus atlanticus]